VKVAIVHYWLVGMRGGEKVVEALGEIYPDADIFTHVYWPESVSTSIRSHKVTTTFISSLPFARTRYQQYLPLMPLALEQLDLHDYDLVISSESGPAKGVITRPDALHVCYCHTPMRYVWSGYHSYRRQAGPLTRTLMAPLSHRLRMWDLASAARVDHFIANSHNVASRIAKYYRREATVIYPPVQMLEPTSDATEEDTYLFVSQLVPYKCADVVIDAFNRMGKKLVVIGNGSEYGRLSRICGPTITMMGWQDNETLAYYYASCRALVFIADEDFGMVPVEAMSAGRPVIAYGRGGALETVVTGVTGILFQEQTAESLMRAVLHFEMIDGTFHRAEIAKRARAFSRGAFKEHMATTLRRWCSEHDRRHARALVTPSAPAWQARQEAPIAACNSENA
jgi:glycosyltransferase involved in cell wall biosynthesis